MTPGIQAPSFLLLLLLTVLTATISSDPTIRPKSTQTLTPRNNAMSNSTERSSVSATSHPATTPATMPAHGSTSSQATSPATTPATMPAHGSTSSQATGPATTPATTPAHGSTSSQATGPVTRPTTTPVTHATSFQATGPATTPATMPAHGSTSSQATGPATMPATTPAHGSTSSQATGPATTPATTPAHGSTSSQATGPATTPATIPAHKSTSAKATTIPVGKGTSSPVSSHHSDMPTTPASHSTRTTASSTDHSTGLPTSPGHKTPPQPPLRISVFFLSFSIFNLPFNSSLEVPSTSYYQELQSKVSQLFLQIYKQEEFLGSSNVKFRPGSVVVESTLAFREGTITSDKVEVQFIQHKSEADRYDLVIGRINAYDVSFPFSARPGSGVPGWGIALLTLVCVLVALTIIYLMALAVCQCRRKNCGQLDIFPTGDSYHPMSEYPTYHTHGRYVPPGGTKRSPYEEVSAGNGGSSLSYMNLAATSANL
nr:PREDICTED: mucin-1 isoform X2 [Rhinolophus sinicus]